MGNRNSDARKCGENISEVTTSTTEAEEFNSDVKEMKSTLKFITWNIDGLNPKNFISRTEAACKLILKKQADIVFLQEITFISSKYIEEHLTDYHCIFGLTYGYFVGTFLKKSTVSYKGYEIINFPTNMIRNCLKVNAVFNNKNLVLFNSHLESMDYGADNRKVQMKKIFQEVLNSPHNTTAIFAGDLNTRDEEVTELGGLPEGIDDLWIVCGSHKECEYTFDMTQNDNRVMDTDFQPRCRYDRIYVRHSSPPHFKQVSFKLIGLKRLDPELCFPSDHWGIMSKFEGE